MFAFFSCKWFDFYLFVYFYIFYDETCLHKAYITCARRFIKRVSTKMKANKILTLLVISLLFISFYSCFKIDPASSSITNGITVTNARTSVTKGTGGTLYASVGDQLTISAYYNNFYAISFEPSPAEVYEPGHNIIAVPPTDIDGVNPAEGSIGPLSWTIPSKFPSGTSIGPGNYLVGVWDLSMLIALYYVNVVISGSASITLSSASGNVGDTVTVTGSSFGNSQAFTVTYDSTVVASGTTTSSGGIPSGTTFTAPSSVKGNHTVTVTQGSNSPTATFTVNPKITLAPSSGSSGVSVTVAGSGFAGSSAVTVNYDAVPQTTTPSTVTTNTSGSFSCSFTVPTSTAGAHTVRASQGASSATATYQLVPLYTISFNATGLASGTSWNVTLNGNTQSSTNETVTFNGLSSGTYGYSINTPSNYICGSATTGSVTVSGASINKPVTFVSTTISDWPMLHHDSLHTGFSNATGPTTNNLLWSTTVSFSAVSSSPAIVDGSLFVGADDGKFYCLNATTGQVLWSQTLFTGAWVWCSPAVANGLVYIGCNDGKLHALYANNGTQKWESAAGSSIQSSPVVVDGVVYFGASDSKLYALDAITGSFLWGATVGNFIVSAPAVVDDVVYFGSIDHYLYAYNTTSHNQIWNCDLNNQIRSSPTVTNGVVYVGSDDNNVYAVNASSGEILWSQTTATSGVMSIPAVVDGVVYVGSGDVYALNAVNGDVLWNKAIICGTDCSPIVVGDILYVGSWDRTAYALNITNGNEVWHKSVGADLWHAPAFANGIVYFGCDDGKIYAFGSVSSYTLTMKTVGHGTVLPGNGTQTAGAIIDIQAIPADGWTFSGWSGDASGSTNTTITITENATVTATFTQDIYSLTMLTIGQGTVSPGNTTYLSGTNVNLTAMNAAGWSFAGWSGDVSGTTNQTITLDQNMTITALFTQDSYSLTILTVGQGTVSSGNQTYLSGTNVTLTATPDDGWSFGNWAGGVTGTINPNSIVMDGNKTVTVTFVENSYILTMITMGNGSVLPGNKTCSYNELVNLKAIADAGWSFSGWTGDALGTTNTTITMNGNYTVTATFTQDYYSFTLIIVGEGDVKARNGTYLSGSVFQLAVKAERGWSFAGWSGDVSSLESRLNVTLNGNMTVIATFTQDVYSLTMITVGAGSVSPGNQTYLSGTVANLTAVNAVGWSFAGWSGDASGLTNTTVAMTGNLTITATFTQDLYTLTMLTVGQGTVLPGNHTYVYGDRVNLQAINAPGWTFNGWTGSTSATANTTITITGNTTVTALFTQDIYTLTVLTTGNGIVTPSNVTYLSGTLVNLTATNAAGWTFMGWGGAASGVTNTTVTMNGNLTVTALFTQDHYTLTMITTGNGNVSPGNQTYLSGTLANLTAMNAKGWTFAGWSGAASGLANTTVTMTGNLTVTAVFTQDVYSLTMLTVGSGSVSPGNHTYLSGTNVDLAAVNAKGWTFSGWSGDASGLTNTTVTLDGNMTVTATFTQNIYSLTMLTVGNGAVSPGNQTYLSGTVANLTAVNAKGWSFTRWLGNASGTTNTTVTMDGNLTVIAVFTQDIYQLTMITTGQGTVSPGNHTYLSGAPVDISAMNAAGWTFSGWSGAASGSTNTTITMNGNMTITATFTQDVYSLTMLTVGQGTVSPGNQTYLSGTNVDIAAMNAKGWTFSGWSGDETCLTNTTITMTGNLTITATFTQDIYTLTMTTTGQGTVSPGNQTYLSGANVDIAAMNAKGWSFSGWSGDASGLANTTITMDGNLTITATFTQDVYALTMLTVGEGSVIPGNQTYLSGTSVDIKAINATHWEFAGWSGDASGLLNTTITMDGDITITATFTKIIYPINIILSGVDNDFTGTVVTIDGTEYTAENLPLSFNWESGSEHSFEFVSTLSVNNGKQYVWESSSGLSTLRNGTLTIMGAGSVTCKYVTQYWFAVSSEHATVGGSGWYFSGTAAHATLNDLTVAIDDSSRYSFAGWSGDASGSGSPSFAVLMNGPKTATATWETQYLVDIVVTPLNAGSTSPNGSIWTAPGQIQVSATPNANYTFKTWTTTGAVSVASTDSANTTVTVSGAGSITANFEAVGSSLIGTVTTNGEVYGIDLSGTITVQQMSNLTITPYADISTTKVEFNVTGPSGTTGFGNLTIPKNAIPFGTTPLVYIDGVLAEDQGYSEDANNYYVWYTTHFSMHKISIDFTSTPQVDYTLYYILAAIGVVLAILLVLVLSRRRKKQ
jgi:uncharacterized repeat protein (TIGR02543 family)